MKSLVEYLIESQLRNINLIELICEENKTYYEDDDIKFVAGYHFKMRQNRGIETNFKTNLVNTNKLAIVNELLKFKEYILKKYNSNNFFVQNNKNIQLHCIGHKFQFSIWLDSVEYNPQSDSIKPMFVLPTIMLTDDDYGNYHSKYRKYKNNPNYIFVDDLR